MLFRGIGARTEPFALGVIRYEYTDAYSTTIRIVVRVELNGESFDAVVDTGSPYVVCSPAVAETLSLDPRDAEETITIQTWRGSFTGGLYRESMQFLAAEGENLQLDVTLFVPHLDQYSDEGYQGPPLFLGLRNCLDAMRFAIDPFEELFYFGPRTTF